MSDSIPHGFRQIPGFPRHAVDENGTVISICPVNGLGENRLWENAKRLNQSTDMHGYRRVCLRHNGLKHTVNVHRIVLTTFVGPRPNGMECRHLDGNKTNNHLSNLAWGTRSENALDKILHGTKQWVGEKNSRSKLNPNDVLEIRRRAASGEKSVSIAKDFPVDHTSIAKIVVRKTWKHI